LSPKKEILGIDCSRYPTNELVTGVELYTKKIIDGLLASDLPFEIRLYTKQKLPLDFPQTIIDLKKYWTLLGLSQELKRNPIDRLFIPSHTLPYHAPAKSFVTVHGLEASHCPCAYTLHQRILQKTSTHRAVKKSAKLIAVSSAVGEDLQRIYKCPSDKIAVVHHGYNPQEIQTQENKHGKYILSVGRLEARKNQLRLIKAFEKISAEFPEYRLVLAGGKGHGSKEINTAIQNSPVKNKILKLGAVEHSQVLGLMQNAEIFAYPSLAEGFGLPILEAFDAGTAVLTSNTTCLPEIAGSGAVLVNPCSTRHIAQELANLLKDKNLREKNIAEGKKQLQNFSWEKCVAQTRKVLVS